MARAVLRRVPSLGLRDWYLGAGAVAQTVWNSAHGFDPAHAIRDYDIAYFDDSDLSESAERAAEAAAERLLADVGATVDVTNEARVHLWYGERFGRDIPAYESVEAAIATWPATATCVGVRYEGDRLVVCAPFGLSDLFDLVVRPNKAIVSRSVYEAKAARWKSAWPRLEVIPW